MITLFDSDSTITKLIQVIQVNIFIFTNVDMCRGVAKRTLVGKMKIEFGIACY